MMRALSNVILWFGSMSWHLWRMVTGRPAYTGLGDTWLTATSFAAVFFIAGLLRWHVLGSAAFLEASLDLLIYAVILLVIAERRTRSSGLVCALFGISAAVDLVVCSLYAVELIPSVDLPGVMNAGITVALMFVAVIRFHREPLCVQRNGYRGPILELRKT
jgi:hypothetical protein